MCKAEFPISRISPKRFISAVRLLCISTIQHRYSGGTARCVGLTSEFYENVRGKAHELGISLSDLIRNAVQQVWGNDTANTEEQDGGISPTVLETLQHKLSVA